MDDNADVDETAETADRPPPPALTDNYYSRTNSSARIALLATTHDALHAEVMSIAGGPFHLVLGDLLRDTVQMDFLRGCSGLVSCVIKCHKVRVIEKWFLHNCTSLRSLDISGMVGVTTIGSFFLCDCSDLTSLDTSGMGDVASIDGTGFLSCCVSLPKPRPTAASLIKRK